MNNSNRITHLSDLEGKYFPVLCILIMIASIFGAWMMHLCNLSAPNGFFILFSMFLMYMIGFTVDANASTIHVNFFKDDEYRGFVKRELGYVRNGLNWAFWMTTIPSISAFFIGCIEPVPFFQSAVMLFNIFIATTMLNLGHSVDMIRNEAVSEQLLNMKNS